MEAGALPRELQRAMARDLRAAFPDMPPIRDFRALAASAAAARQEVRRFALVRLCGGARAPLPARQREAELLRERGREKKKEA